MYATCPAHNALVNFHRMSPPDSKLRIPHMTVPSCEILILFVLSVLSAMKLKQLSQHTHYSISLTGRYRGLILGRSRGLHFSTVPSLDLGPTHPPVKGVLKTLSVGIKRPGLEAAHPYPSHAMDRKTCSYTSNSSYFFKGFISQKTQLIRITKTN